MARSILQASLFAALLTTGLAGCAADVPLADAGGDQQTAVPTAGSGEWNTPKGLDVGTIKGGIGNSLPNSPPVGATPGQP
ncbi:MAG: hypothetical protein JWL84_2290 [Rhodospirillales bacterium]|nr:hypothetical protein [Rhodospirillales bacterium]